MVPQTPPSCVIAAETLAPRWDPEKVVAFNTVLIELNVVVCQQGLLLSGQQKARGPVTEQPQIPGR
jgi:hypothetical protein